MNNTPPPVSAASAAARMRSGVGEVKTWPGHAASSIPCPTNPVGSGPCPEPPPDSRAALPGLRCRRCTNGASSPIRTISECAAQNPARLSLIAVSTSLISFFILASPARVSVESDSGVLSLFEHDLFGKPVPDFPDHAFYDLLSASGILDQPCDFLRELTQQ